jgi:CRP-like cAMP-binding protein
MEPDHVKKLAALATELKFAQGQVIYREGDLGQAIYFIEEGQVVIELNSPEGSPATVSTVGPGQLFGWSALFPPRRKRANARATLPTRVIAIDAARLQEVFRTDQQLENEVIQRVTEVIADRLSEARLHLAHSVQVTK